MSYPVFCFKLLAILSCTTMLTSLANIEVQATESTVSSSVITSDMISYDTDDYYSDWKQENPNYINLNGSTASINGTGVVVNGSDITITAAGVYVISGKLDDGQILIDVADEGNVKLVLNGAQITCSDNAAIFVSSADKTIISLVEGTQNVVSDGSTYAVDTANAPIYSKDDLTIYGTGTLTVNGNYNNGITCKDSLKITEGNININSVDDGLIGKDKVVIKGGNFIIKAGGDGIRATNDTDTLKGFVAILGGNFNITSVTDAIQAETNLLIEDGEFNINTGGGSINGASVTQNPGGGPMGQTTTTATTTTVSSKALKGLSDVTISGGTFTIDSCDDSIHSNNNITISGGDISIKSGDDGIHSDTTLTINSGKIDITKSYEGIESSIINISGGNINVVASDDGINVAGGADSSSVSGRPGENTFTPASTVNKLNINGGYVTVNAGGDGLDANGSIYMAAGTVLVNGPTDNGNGPMDYDGEFVLSGGYLIASGSSGMAQAPSANSTEGSILMKYSSVQQAGTVVNLKDSSGKIVVTFTPSKNYQSILICSPALQNNTAYSLYSGNTKIVDFTITTAITMLSPSGVTSRTGGTITAGGTVTTPLAISTFKANVASPQTVGTAITLSTSVAGGTGSLQTKYEVYNGTIWTLIKDYSTAVNSVWNPSVAGTYQIKATVKDSTEATVSSTMNYVIDAVPVVDAELEVTSIAADIQSPQESGTSIALSLTSSGGTGTIQSKFVAFDGKTWTDITNYSEQTTATWKPTKAGTYTIYACVKDSTGKIERKTMSYVIKGTLAINSFKSNIVSPQEAGTSITLSSTSSGGTGTLQSKYVVFDGKTWTIIKDYSLQEAAIWKPTKAGTYTLYACVKDATGKIERKEMTYVIKGAAAITINSFISKISSPQNVGTSITLSSTASGGVGTLQCKFVAFDGSNWVTLKDYSTQGYAIWKPTKAGSYTLYVCVMDATGKIERKTMSYVIK